MSDARVYLLMAREEWDVDGPDYVVGVYESEADAARVAQRLEDLNEDTDEWERLSVSIRSAPFHPTRGGADE